MLDILILGLAICSLYHIQIVKPIRSINQDYLSLESCNAFRGIFALIVIFHHLAHRTSGGVFFRLFEYVGYIAVAVFFFFSGYGLMKKHMLSPRYYENFLLNRIPSVLLPYLVVTGIYWLVYAGTGNIYSIKQILISTFLNGSPIVLFSWYIIVILLFYLCFWLLMVVFKKRYLHMIIATCVLCVLYIFLCRYLNYGVHWYYSVFSIVVGMLWAYKETDLLKLLNSHYPAVAISVIIITVGYLMSISIFPTLRRILEPQYIYTCLFCVIIVLFSMKIRLRSKIAQFLGKLSLELYMLHGLPIVLFQNVFCIQNELIFCLTVIFSSVALAAVLHVLFRKMLACYRKVVFKQRVS